MHGGTTPIGPAAGAFKHGRYSKLIPTRLAATYEISRQDPDLLALRDEIALVDSRIGSALDELSRGESRELWEQIDAEYGTLRGAIDQAGPATVLTSMKRLDGLFAQRRRQYQLWQEIDELIEQRRRLVDTERRRLVDMEQMLTAQQALVLVGAIVGIVKEHVSDRQTLARIASDVARLTDQPSRGAADRDAAG